MAKFKEIMKIIWANVWHVIKGSFLSLVFYGIASGVCFMALMNEEWTGPMSEGLNATRLMWLIIAVLLAAAYNGMVSYANGGRAYEMLVSGNMKRVSAERLGSQIKISVHKEVEEYRDWKGFVCGGVIAVFTVLFGILMEANAEAVNEALVMMTKPVEEGVKPSQSAAILMLVCLLLSGWSLLPFAFANMAGASVSYLYSCLFGLIPIIVSGALYIVGAYAKRAKAIRAQIAADAASKAQVEKPKKINYGGLPGTKPNKKRK